MDTQKENGKYGNENENEGAGESGGEGESEDEEQRKIWLEYRTLLYCLLIFEHHSL